jgi:ubiquinone/menaquinone biosynthesis C-methylase UbiE
MKRIPEPQLMNDPEQARAYAEADFSEPHTAFVQYFRDRFADFAAGEVVDLGCGAADVTIRFANAYPGSMITAIDGASAMLKLGRIAVHRAGLSERIQFFECVLPSAALRAQRFDAVLSNSLLHHLDDPLALWQTVTQIARPGAIVHIMDLLRPDTPTEAQRVVRLYAREAPAILRRDFYNSLRAAYTVEEVVQQLAASALERLSVETVSDRHLLVSGRLRR